MLKKLFLLTTLCLFLSVGWSKGVSGDVYRKLVEVHKKIQTNDTDAALIILNILRANTKINDYERQFVMENLGFVYFKMGDTPKAINAYEALLGNSTIEDKKKKTTTYTLAQLYTNEKKFTTANSFIEEYFELEGDSTPNAYLLYAKNLYQLKRYGEVIEAINNAISTASSKGIEIKDKESWHDFRDMTYKYLITEEEERKKLSPKLDKEKYEGLYPNKRINNLSHLGIEK